MKVFALLRGVLLLLPLAAVGGLESAQASHHTAPVRPLPVYFRCKGYWVPDGVIAGPTAGYPYYGWYGYPYVPYRCVCLHHPRYRAYRHRWLRSTWSQ